MAQLTTEDIEKISLYIPFNVMFGPQGFKNGLMKNYHPCGILDGVVIRSWERGEDDPNNTDLYINDEKHLPFLNRLERMSDEHFNAFNSLAGLKLGRYQLFEMINMILTRANPNVLFFALSQQYDIFGLIPQGKAIDMYNGAGDQVDTVSSSIDLIIIDDVDELIDLEKLFRNDQKIGVSDPFT